MSERNVQSEIITPDQSHSGVEGLLQIVSVKVGNEEFGLDILRVQEIIRIQGLTRVPNSPVFVAGVINLRGRVIPIIALRKRFGLPDQAHDKETRIVVLEVQNMVLGFIVDSVSEVLRIPADTVEAPPRLGNDVGENCAASSPAPQRSRSAHRLDLAVGRCELTERATAEQDRVLPNRPEGDVGQDEATSAVYGMPRCCAETGVLRKIVPLPQLSRYILQALCYRMRP